MIAQQNRPTLLSSFFAYFQIARHLFIVWVLFIWSPFIHIIIFFFFFSCAHALIVLVYFFLILLFCLVFLSSPSLVFIVYLLVIVFFHCCFILPIFRPLLRSQHRFHYDCQVLYLKGFCFSIAIHLHLSYFISYVSSFSYFMRNSCRFSV